LLDRALGGQRLFFAAKDVRLDLEIAGPLPPASLDGPQIERVLANLLTNALKFTPSGGRVRVEARLGGERLARILIEDSGEGIPPGAEEAIFERFARVSDRRDSTGLGLYISRAIVAAHGGRLFAESRADDRGARFVVELPLLPPPV
jgi:signal transduction histidine kinase